MRCLLGASGLRGACCFADFFLHHSVRPNTLVSDSLDPSVFLGLVSATRTAAVSTRSASLLVTSHVARAVLVPRPILQPSLEFETTFSDLAVVSRRARSKMARSYTGYMSLSILEAKDLPQKIPLPGGLVLTSIDPYLVVAVDKAPFGETKPKPKTFAPVWREDMESFVLNAAALEFTIFHKKTVPPDAFVANTVIDIEEIMVEGEEDVWVRQLKLSCSLILQDHAL